MFTHTITYSWSRANENPLGYSVPSSAGGEVNLDEDIPIAAATEFDIAIDVSQLKSLMLVADVDCTVKTNNSGAPDNTLNLKANKPLVWESQSGYFATPLTVDVTKLFINSAAAGTLKLRGLVDPTP